jgi:hypothetical protein
MEYPWPVNPGNVLLDLILALGMLGFAILAVRSKPKALAGAHAAVVWVMLSVAVGAASIHWIITILATISFVIALVVIVRKFD